ncbi:MAG: transposase [Desulfomonilia bacterium]
MARPLRVSYPGAFYHITARGNERKQIFSSDRDRQQFLSYLESAHMRYGALFHGYCLMENHYHLLMETPRENLSRIMHHINGAYTMYYNVKMERSGHLFQGRYRSILVEKDAYCLELSRYIHLNPVRAGMVKKVEDYPWSSYLSYTGERDAQQWMETGFVLASFGKDTGAARKRYREFVKEGERKNIENPLEQVCASMILGRESFHAFVRKRIEETLREADQRDVPALKAFTTRPSLDRIAQVVADVCEADSVQIKKMSMWISQDIGGYSLSEIGRRYGMQRNTVSQSNRRYRLEIRRDGELQKLVREVRRKLEMSHVKT